VVETQIAGGEQYADGASDLYVDGANDLYFDGANDLYFDGEGYSDGELYSAG
jgi:hypothetical protein